MRAEIERHDVNLSNWRLYPNSRLSFQAVSEFVPAAIVTLPRSAAAHASLGNQPLSGITVTVDGKETALEAYLLQSSTDSFMVMRDGMVIAEWHDERADRHRPHLIFSVSKSLTGLLAGIAAADGVLDPDAAVADYVPMTRDGAYGSARVRDLLDMTVDLDFDEEYTDADGAFDRYRRAMLWNPARGTEETMEGLLASLPRKGGVHGRRFYYASPNTDMLGLVIERATGCRYPRYLAERLLEPLGATGLSYVTVDRAGTARAAGGICLTPHDLALIGQMVLDGGASRDGTQVVDEAWITDMRTNGNRQAWVDGNFADMFAKGRYRSCWYQSGDASDSFCGVGIHGQWLWVDPSSRVVIVKTSCQPEASDDRVLHQEIAVLGQVAASLS